MKILIWLVIILLVIGGFFILTWNSDNSDTGDSDASADSQTDEKLVENYFISEEDDIDFGEPY